MTISEAQTCRARGVSRETITAQLAASAAALARADALVIARTYGASLAIYDGIDRACPMRRPAYPSETVRRPMTAYDYNGR